MWVLFGDMTSLRFKHSIKATLLVRQRNNRKTISISPFSSIAKASSSHDFIHKFISHWSLRVQLQFAEFDSFFCDVIFFSFSRIFYTFRYNIEYLRYVAAPLTTIISNLVEAPVAQIFSLHETFLTLLHFFLLFRDSSLPASKESAAMRWKWSWPRPASARWYLRTTYRKWIRQNSIKSKIWPSWRVSMKHPSYTISRIDTTQDWFM